MSKVTFRPKFLDSGRQMAIYVAEVLPDLGEFSAINRSVPQMPTGMEKEEESEHHLLKAICSGHIIPTPEVNYIDEQQYSQLYPKTFKQPKQLIRLQLAFLLDSDEPEYNTDTEDEKWLLSQANKINIDERKFESIMDRLEKSSGQTVISLCEAKSLIKDDADVVIAIYDYWLNKRLRKQHPLICSVKTDSKLGSNSNNPYIAFRKRVEKMQTRKNRKNDEISYERMVKFKRDLVKAMCIAELIRKRERLKKDKLIINTKVAAKRNELKDFNGDAYQEAVNSYQKTIASMPTQTSMSMSMSTSSIRSVFSTLYHQNENNWMERVMRDDVAMFSHGSPTASCRRSGLTDKRQYKKRKTKSSLARFTDLDAAFTSDDDESTYNATLSESEEDESPFVFKRNKNCAYHMPKNLDERAIDNKYQYSLTSLSDPSRCLGFSRRRIGRGGRVIIDRAASSIDDLLKLFDNKVIERKGSFCPKLEQEESTIVFDVEPVPEIEIKQESQPSSNPNSLSIPITTPTCIPISNPPSSIPTATLNLNAGPSLMHRLTEQPSFNIGTKMISDDFLMNTNDFLDEIENWPHYRPVTPPPNKPKIDVETGVSMFSTDDLQVSVQIQSCDINVNDKDKDPLFTTGPMNLIEDFSNVVFGSGLVSESWLTSASSLPSSSSSSSSSSFRDNNKLKQNDSVKPQPRGTSTSTSAVTTISSSKATSVSRKSTVTPSQPSIPTVYQPPSTYVPFTTNDHSTYFNHKLMPNHITNGPERATNTQQIRLMKKNQSSSSGARQNFNNVHIENDGSCHSAIYHHNNSQSSNLIENKQIKDDEFGNKHNLNGAETSAVNRKALVRKNNTYVMEVT